MADQQGDIEARARLRELPSVEELARGLEGASHELAVGAAREQIAAARLRILDGEEVPELEALRRHAGERLRELARPTLVRVINATGVVLHTNLGRAPLAASAAATAVEIASGYSNLEYDLDRGERSSRQVHVERLLCELSGAEAAFAVNNNAAAVLLVLAATSAGREVIVGRGQLVEIGDSFRIPEILARSGATLVEVGTTNRTVLADYERAIGEDTVALLRVHQSNFRTVGFVAEVGIDSLCALATRRGLFALDDLGSGAIDPIADEPVLRASVAAGADLVCCSADKLLGGPQAGIICGTSQAVELCRRDPLARALRFDKLQLAALEATLRLHRDGDRTLIPALAMLGAGEEELGRRAELIVSEIGSAARVALGLSRPGGGTLPLLELPGPVCEVDAGGVGPERLAERLRGRRPPVVGRISANRLILDPRTMSDAEAVEAGRAVVGELG